MITKIATTLTQKKAVVIKGNPKYLKDEKQLSDQFYRDISNHLKSHGYTVEFDAGTPYTVPPKADFWVAHSRGMSRLRFAPSGTKTLRVDDYLPADQCEANGTPRKSHYIVTPQLLSAISRLA